jgi:hypothetical protein
MLQYLPACTATLPKLQKVSRRKRYAWPSGNEQRPRKSANQSHPARSPASNAPDSIPLRRQPWGVHVSTGCRGPTNATVRNLCYCLGRGREPHNLVSYNVFLVVLRNYRQSGWTWYDRVTVVCSWILLKHTHTCNTRTRTILWQLHLKTQANVHCATRTCWILSRVYTIFLDYM